MRQVLHLQVAWTVAAYLKEGTGCFFHEHLLASVWTVAVALSLDVQSIPPDTDSVGAQVFILVFTILTSYCRPLVLRTKWQR